MKNLSTHFLRFTLFVMAMIVLAFCVFALPSAWYGGSAEFPTASYAVKLIVIGLYVTAIPFYIALWQTLKLLSYIDQNIAFSELSVKALKDIKYCASVIGILYIGGVPLLFPIADADDAPGLLIVGAVIAGIPLAVAVFVGLLERLVKSVSDSKVK